MRDVFAHCEHTSTPGLLYCCRCGRTRGALRAAEVAAFEPLTLPVPEAAGVTLTLRDPAGIPVPETALRLTLCRATS